MHAVSLSTNKCRVYHNEYGQSEPSVQAFTDMQTV